MKKINGIRFNEIPHICGVCPASSGLSGSHSSAWKQPSKVFCHFFNLSKGFNASTPKRCMKLFEKAFSLEAEDLVIVINNQTK